MGKRDLCLQPLALRECVSESKPKTTFVLNGFPIQDTNVYPINMPSSRIFHISYWYLQDFPLDLRLLFTSQLFPVGGRIVLYGNLRFEKHKNPSPVLLPPQTKLPIGSGAWERHWRSSPSTKWHTACWGAEMKALCRRKWPFLLVGEDRKKILSH